MIPFAIVLLSIGCADLVAGFSGRPQGWARSATACVFGVGSGIGLAGALGLEATEVLRTGVLLSIVLPVWIWVRSEDRLRVWRGASGFWGFLGLCVALIATSSRKPALTDGGNLAVWLKDVPIKGFDEHIERVLLCAALIVFLLATANGIVRLILAMSGSSSYQERRLRGGRMIGPLERLLIFGFAVAGQITAAVLVVSAKTLLRFPEASREARGRSWESHSLNEYLVVGSLGSWVLAFAAAALFRGWVS